MIKQFWITVLTVCLSAYSSQASNLNTSENDSASDGSFGLVVRTYDENKKKLEMIFLPQYPDMQDHQDRFLILAIYDGLTDRALNEEITLQFKIVDKYNKTKTITVTSAIIAEAVINNFKENKKQNPGFVKFAREFMIDKKDYEFFSKAKTIDYFLSTQGTVVKGTFSNDDLRNIKKYEKNIIESKSEASSDELTKEEL